MLYYFFFPFVSRPDYHVSGREGSDTEMIDLRGFDFNALSQGCSLAAPCLKMFVQKACLETVILMCCFFCFFHHTFVMM